jgi:hypothetical protein
VHDEKEARNMKRNFSVYLFSSILLVTFSGVAGASDAPKTAADAPKTTAAERVSQLEAQPVLEAPKVVGAQEPIKAYFYDNRVEYYDSKLLKEIQKETKAAMVSDRAPASTWCGVDGTQPGTVTFPPRCWRSIASRGPWGSMMRPPIRARGLLAAIAILSIPTASVARAGSAAAPAMTPPVPTEASVRPAAAGRSDALLPGVTGG